MIRMLHDRYLHYDHDRVCDLVTGELGSVADAGADDEHEDERSVATLIELLEHGRDGTPRWVVADARSAHDAALTGRRVAAAARRLGYVAVSAALAKRWRSQLEAPLADRAVLLLGGFGEANADARAQLVWASTLSVRPHILLTFRTARRPLSRLFAREARSAYGTSEAVAPKTVWSQEVQRHLQRAVRATAFMRGGRHAAAERLLREVAATLERRRASAAAAEVLITLATFLLERGRAIQAEAECREAVRLADAAAASDIARTARVWQAWARTDLGQLTEAESLLRALLLPGDPAGAPGLAEVALARCLLSQQRVEDARRALPGDECFDALPSLECALAYDVAVRTALATGHVFNAGQYARRALRQGAEAADPLVSVITHTSHLRVLCASGDLELARAMFEDVLRLTAVAHSPCRATHARIIWAEALRRGGLPGEFRRQAVRLARVAPLSTALTRRSISDVANVASASDCGVSPSEHRHDAALALELIGIVHHEDEDRRAVQLVLDRVLRLTAASRLELLSADPGPVTVLVGAGGGLATTLGSRVMESGLAIGFEAGSSEAGVAVRLGSKLLGALACRWPIDRRIPESARAELELAAAIVAPRVDALLLTARHTAEASTAVPDLVGVSAAIEDVRRAIARAARAPFAVLIEGESGTGKELVARAIHQLGPRRDRRFCDVNCAALPDELLESELFGHARGAFTGALVERAGLFEEANGGTLFMDELADLSPRGQAKLLRVVQQQEIRRVGETFSRTIDVRLIAAANRDMHGEAAAGRFRQDLLYRIDVIRIRLPPLRERAADIALLAHHFWATACARVGSKATLTPAVVGHLSRYSWPGNVRELQNVMSALAVAAPPRGRVGSVMLPSVIAAATRVSSLRLADARRQFDRRFIDAALASSAGSRTRAAAALGVSRQGLLKLMTRLGLAAAEECT